MMPRPKLYLTGFSGTGKTISGAKAAQLLRMPFVDMDEVIEYRTRKPITQIFAEDGEPEFRRMETQLLQELSTKPSRVVSTGGGVPSDSQNRAIMAASGVVILLTASVEAIYARVKPGTRRDRQPRPMLGPEITPERIAELLEERRFAYGAANATVDTDGKSHDDVAAEVVEQFNRLRESPDVDASA